MATTIHTSDAPEAKEFVYVGADDVTLSGTTIYGPAQAGAELGERPRLIRNRSYLDRGGIRHALACCRRRWSGGAPRILVER